MLIQPDFNEIFFKTFQPGREGVEYQAREDSNLPHDIYFLSSLLRGAELFPKDISHSKETLTFPLTRRRWELKEEVEKQNLLRISSELRISGVKKIRWISDTSNRPPYEGKLFDSDQFINIDQSYEIDAFALANSRLRNGSFKVVLHGCNWRIQITLDHFSWSIFIKDVQHS